MAVTSTIGTSLNPLSGVTGATIPSTQLIPDIARWAEELEPRETPVWSRVKKIGARAENQDKLEWGQSYHRRIDGTIAEALDTTETGVDLTAAAGTYGDGDSIKKWNVIEIIDWQAGSTTLLDYSTREEVIVDTDPDGSNTITVKRGNGSGTGVAHASGAYWAVCGTAMPYNRDFTLSPIIRGDKLYNRYQRFFEMAQADVAARNTHTYEFQDDDPLLVDFERATKQMKWEAERALVSGQRLDGDAAAGDSALPGKMGGIDYFITNHSGRVTNLSGAPLSIFHLDDVLRDMYKKVAAPTAYTMLMSIDTASILDSFLNPVRQADATDTVLSTYITEVRLRLAKLEIMQTQHMPNGTILFVDFDKISVVPYKGCEWQKRDVPTSGPYDRLAIWGQYSVMVEEVTRMAKLHGFEQSLAAYPRDGYF